MPYGYLGQNTPNQTVSNSGVFSISDVADLEKQGKFGGSLELIEEQTASSTKVIFSSIQESKYDVHYLTIENITHSTSGKVFLRLYESGVEETASVYQNASLLAESDGSFTERRDTVDNLLFETSNTFGPINFYTYCYNFGNSSKYSFVTYQGADWDGKSSNYFGGGVLPQASTVDGISINSTQTMQSGTIKLYGVKQL
jgi:hypothetical protein